MHTSTHELTYIQAHMTSYTYKHTCTHQLIQAHTNSHTYKHTRTHIHTSTHELTYIQAHTNSHTYKHTRTHIHTSTNVHTNAYKHTRTHIHTSVVVLKARSCFFVDNSLYVPPLWTLIVSLENVEPLLLYVIILVLKLSRSSFIYNSYCVGNTCTQIYWPMTYFRGPGPIIQTYFNYLPYE